MAGSQKSKDKYLSEKVETFVVRVPKGKKEAVKAFAKSKGLSLNAFILGLINEAMNESDKK